MSKLARFLDPEVYRRNEELEAEVKSLKEKLAKKQEHINKVNAFWKAKFYAKNKPRTS